jgi:hypothetical protein
VGRHISEALDCRCGRDGPGDGDCCFRVSGDDRIVIADSGVAVGNCGAQVHFHLVRAQGHPQQMPLDELSVGLGDWFRVRAVCVQVTVEDIDDQRLWRTGGSPRAPMTTRSGWAACRAVMLLIGASASRPVTLSGACIWRSWIEVEGPG